MKNDIFWLTESGIHMPTKACYELLKRAKMLGFWFFCDSLCSDYSFEKLVPLIIYYCQDVTIQCEKF